MSEDNHEPLANFEQQIAELEKITKDLESGELSLEQALQAYERGVALTRQCQTALNQAEQRISVLMERDGELVEEPYDGDS